MPSPRGVAAPDNPVPEPPRSHRHAQLRGDADDARDLRGARGPHDRERPHRDTGERFVVGVLLGDRIAGEHMGRADDLAQAIEEISHVSVVWAQSHESGSGVTPRSAVYAAQPLRSSRTVRPAP